MGDEWNEGEKHLALLLSLLLVAGLLTACAGGGARVAVKAGADVELEITIKGKMREDAMKKPFLPSRSAESGVLTPAFPLMQGDENPPAPWAGGFFASARVLTVFWGNDILLSA